MVILELMLPELACPAAELKVQVTNWVAAEANWAHMKVSRTADPNGNRFLAKHFSLEFFLNILPPPLSIEILMRIIATSFNVSFQTSQID
jgi:hypothetical protein